MWSRMTTGAFPLTLNNPFSFPPPTAHQRPAGSLAPCMLRGLAALPPVARLRCRRSRGYGTVRFATKEAALAAIEQFNGFMYEERALTVKLDRFG